MILNCSNPFSIIGSSAFIQFIIFVWFFRFFCIHLKSLIVQQPLTLLFQKFEHSGRPLVGTFSAASNVTGILTDTNAVATLLHRYGALSLWDYATAGRHMVHFQTKKPKSPFLVAACIWAASHAIRRITDHPKRRRFSVFSIKVRIKKEQRPQTDALQPTSFH